MIPITDQTKAAYPYAPGDAKTAAAAKQAAEGPGFQLFGKDGFTFGDFIDIINPLQHIPIVSTVYRQITGDDLDPGSRIGGGVLFGGPIGLVASLVNVVVDETTGKDVGEQVMALFDGGGAPSRTTDAPSRTAELTAPSGAPVWTNPDAIVQASFTAAAAGEVGKITEKASPVREDINVLVWAQRETAFRQRAQAAEAAIEETKIARRVATMQVSGTQIAALAGSLEPSPDSREAAVAGAKASPRQFGAGAAPPPGAAAPLGGWFSDAMLSALTKYQAASALNNSALNNNGGSRPAGGRNAPGAK